MEVTLTTPRVFARLLSSTQRAPNHPLLTRHCPARVSMTTYMSQRNFGALRTFNGQLHPADASMFSMLTSRLGGSRAWISPLSPHVFMPSVFVRPNACLDICKVDYGRVHIEEEGRVLSQTLDSQNLIPTTCWQVRNGDGGKVT